MAIDWEAAYRANGDAIMKLAYVVLRDRDLASEVVQNTFEAAFRKRDKFDPGRSLRPWLLGIASREALRLARRQRLRRVLPLDRQHTAPRLTGLETQIWEAVRALPARQRLTVTLFYLYGYQVVEIASILGVPRGTVASRLHNARNALRACLADAEGESIA